MPDYFKTFKVGDEILDVRPENLAKFKAKFPDAKEYKAFVVGNDTLDVALDNLPKFQKRYPDAKPLYQEPTQEQSDKTFAQVLRESVMPSTQSEALSNIPGLGGLPIGESILKAINQPRYLMTAAIAKGQGEQGTFTQQYEKKIEPSELVPPGLPGSPFGPTSLAPQAMQNLLYDLAIDPLLLPIEKVVKTAGLMPKILKIIGKDKVVTKVTADEVRKLLQTVPELKRLQPMSQFSDEGIAELVRRGEAAGVKSTGEVVAKEATNKQKLLERGAIPMGESKIIPKERGLPPGRTVYPMHSEGIAESIKKVNEVPKPKAPGKQKVSVPAKYAKTEKTPLEVITEQSKASPEGLVEKVAEIPTTTPKTAPEATKAAEAGVSMGKAEKPINIESWVRKSGRIKSSDLNQFGISHKEDKGLFLRVAKKDGRGLDDIGASAIDEGIIPPAPKDVPPGDWLVQNLRGKGKAGVTAEEQGIRETVNSMSREGTLPKNVTSDQMAEILRKDIKTEEVPAFSIKQGDEFTVAGEKYKVIADDGKNLTLKDGTEVKVSTEDNVVLDKGSLKETATTEQLGKKAKSLEQQFIEEQAKKGTDIRKVQTMETKLAGREKLKAKLAENKAKGQEDIFAKAEESKQTDLLSGTDFTKGIINAVKKDITDKSAGIISDPYRNVKKFLSENKVKLTDEEVAKIHNFARNLSKATMAESKRENLFNDYLTKNFPKLKFEATPKTAPKTPVEEIVNMSKEASAEKFSQAHDKSRKAFEESEKTTIKKLYQSAKRKVVDVSGNIKKDLMKTEGGKEAVIKHDLAAGAHPRAAKIFDEKRKLIYKGLSKDEISTLDKMIDAKRTVTIDSYKEGMQHHFGVTGQDAQAYLDSVPKKLRDKLEPRIKEYHKAMRETLQKRLDEGLITKEQFDELNKYDYSPRKFIQYAGNEVYNFGGKPISVPNSGIKSLQGGSTEAMQTNTHLLLSEVINQTETMIARNQANKAMYSIAEANANNGIVSLIPKKGTHTEINVMIDGKKQSMWMPNEIAQEWVRSSPEVSAGISNFVGWISGGKILKPMATGLNPVFALTNFPRDIAHVYLTTSEYSTILPKYIGQMTSDIAHVAKDALLRKGQFVDFINQGGGMEFLTHQGKITSKTGGISKAVQNVLGYIGETSEMITRLALRRRAMLNGKSAEEATWIGRNYLDFSQGGSWAKAADTAVPYLNAGIQGTRGIFRAAATDTKNFVWKVSQLGALASGLYLANRYKNPEAWAQIPMRDKVNNWIITTPFTFTDKQGNKRYYYMKIAKDQGQRVIASVIENLIAKATGNEVDGDQIAAAVQDALPIIPTQNLPPTLKAMLGYAANKDFWRNDDIWKGDKVKPYAEKDKYTAPFFITAGEKLNISPIRTQYAVEQFTTSNNIYTSLTGGLWNEITGQASKETNNLVTQEMVLKNPFVNRMVKATDPYEPHRKTIQDAELEANTKRYERNYDFDKKVDEYFAGTINKSGVIDYIKKLNVPYNEKKDLVTRFKIHTRIGNIPDRRFWVNLSRLAPQARAYVFYGEWLNKTEKEKSDFLRTAIKTKIATKDFIREFNRLKK